VGLALRENFGGFGSEGKKDGKGKIMKLKFLAFFRYENLLKEK
jgi:hypothetical protein